MGQYFTLINLDKREFVHAHQIGNGLKIGEQTGWDYSTETAGLLLLGKPSQAHPLVGRWHGDTRVGFVGDYGGSQAIGDVPLHDELKDRAEELYGESDEEGDWTNISPQVREMMSALFGIRYEGDG